VLNVTFTFVFLNELVANEGYIISVISKGGPFLPILSPFVCFLLPGVDNYSACVVFFTAVIFCYVLFNHSFFLFL
jgi:hypothetical protein